MNSKIYEICGIVAAVICLVLCLVFVPNIGAIQFIGIIFFSFWVGVSAFDLSYFILFKFLESTNPADWDFAIMERWFEDGTRKYQPVVKTVKFGYYTNIDKTFLSSVAIESEFDTYEEAEEMIKAFKELEFQQYNEQIKALHDRESKSEKKIKVLGKKYIKI